MILYKIPTSVPEAGPHDNGLVAVLLVVVVDLGDGLDTGVLAGRIRQACHTKIKVPMPKKKAIEYRHQISNNDKKV